MDHIWLDQTRQLEPADVPLYDEVQYDGNGMDDYLERLGISIEGLVNYIRESVSSSEPAKHALMANSILQEWLFFGCLLDFFSIFEIEVSRDVFISSGTEGLRISTSNLVTLFELLLDHKKSMVANGEAIRAWWKVSVPEMQGHNDPISLEDLDNSMSTMEKVRLMQTVEDGRESRYATQLAIVESKLKITRQFLALYMKDLAYTGVIDYDNWVSIWILTETLESLIMVGFWHKLSLPKEPYLGEIWAALCQSNNVCTAKSSKVFYSSSVTEAYISTTLTHADSGNHSGCKITGPCLLNQQPPSSTGSAHLSDCYGKCEMIGLSPSAISAMHQSIISGSFPIVYIERDSDGVPIFQVQAYSDELSSFVAFSHVWAHGLGNKTHNALPSCQIHRLMNIITEADSEKSAIWLDTLCIPHDKTLKRKAISMMAQVYQKADKVIVIDRDLSTSNSNPVTLRIGLLMSDWMSRLWTFQEGYLPQDRLHIVTAEQIVPIVDVLRHPLQSKDVCELLAMSDHSRVQCEIRMMRLNNHSHLLACVENFQERATTRAEDEVLCLAVLMDVSVTSLPSSPKLYHVLEKLQQVPQDLLFAHGPREKVSGFRWLPTAFLNRPQQKTYEVKQEVVPIGKHGIRVTKPIIKLPSPFFFDPLTAEGSHQRLWLLFHSPIDEEPYRVFFLSNEDEEHYIQEQSCTRSMNDAMLVFEKPNKYDDACEAAVLVSGRQYTNADFPTSHYETKLVTVEYKHFCSLMSTEDWLPCRVDATIQDSQTIWID